MPFFSDETYLYGLPYTARESDIRRLIDLAQSLSVIKDHHG